MQSRPPEIDPRALRAALQDGQSVHPVTARLLDRAAAAIRPTGPAPEIEEARDA